MKITIKTLMGDNVEIILSKNPTIGELRTAIAKRLARPSEMLEIVRMTDKQGKVLCPLYKDDSSALKLIDHIKTEVEKPDLVLDELCVFVRLALGAGFYRPAKNNPKGQTQREPQENKLFPGATTPLQSNHFGERLQKLGIASKDIPDKFFDPKTGEVTENPDPKLRFELIQFIEQQENNAAIARCSNQPKYKK